MHDEPVQLRNLGSVGDIDDGVLSSSTRIDMRCLTPLFHCYAAFASSYDRLLLFAGAGRAKSLCYQEIRSQALKRLFGRMGEDD